MTDYHVNSDVFSAIQNDGTNGSDVATFISGVRPGIWNGIWGVTSGTIVMDDSVLAVVDTTVVPVDSWLVAVTGGTRFYKSEFDTPVIVLDDTTFTSNFTVV
ncbi:MAG TPA: hypothetical protein VHV10_04760 [Ktedonobacteraceae bacterium]|nr:hypothetical protein [Ktedonobacteraceae bacterium]